MGVGVGTEQEAQWVLQARRGDQQAFAGLVTAYQVPVFNLALRMLGSPAEAEDAAQETFLRAYTKLETYDATRKFSSWLLSIASHYCVDKLRRREYKTTSVEEVEAWHWVPDETPRPEEQLLDKEQLRHIQRLLAQLPADYRLVIVLRYWQDLSYEEIAEMTHTTESAVKSRLHRARQMLAVRMNQEERAATSAKKNVERRVPQNALLGSF
jgi:RNA polymerase sigma-70 factor, ECF subfamily